LLQGDIQFGRAASPKTSLRRLAIVGDLPLVDIAIFKVAFLNDRAQVKITQLGFIGNIDQQFTVMRRLRMYLFNSLSFVAAITRSAV
jgi:hypothetical protein